MNSLIKNILPFVAAQKNLFMSQNGFTMYMLSLENDLLNPSHTRVYQDMTYPLAHYFISSSHNTYLTKDQVTGASSTEPYIRYSDTDSPKSTSFLFFLYLLENLTLCNHPVVYVILSMFHCQGSESGLSLCGAGLLGWRQR